MRPLAVLHGGQTAVERRQQLERFLTGTASVLLATDVAGQGLNLQARARWVVSLELPWNPARLEQRIGRVDRIGQTRGVHATLLVARDGAEAGLLANLARRTLTARQALRGDVLDIGVPDESAIAAALIDRRRDGASDGAAAASLGLSTVAAARARGGAPAAVVAIARRRDGATTARAARRRGRVSARWRAWGCRPERRGLAVFTVPVIDLTGTVVERHVVALVAEGHVLDLDRRRRRDRTLPVGSRRLVPIAPREACGAFMRRAATTRIRRGSCALRPASSAIGFHPKRSPDCSTGVNSRRSKPRRGAGLRLETMRAEAIGELAIAPANCRRPSA